jgi:hypothetical protein
VAQAKLAYPAAATLEPAWTANLDTGGFPTLLPLPGGGLVVSTRSGLIGVAETGEVLWQRTANVNALDWVLVGDRLVATMPGERETVWSMDREGAVPWLSVAGGRLAVSGDRVLAYDSNGICLLDPETRATKLWVRLPGGFPGYADLISLPDGSVLVTHKTVSGGSLIAFNADGSLRWRRAYSDLVPGRKRLFTTNDRAYLAVETHATSSSQVVLYEIDLDSAELVRLFIGGTRYATPAHTWTVVLGDLFVVHIGGTGTIALDPQRARETALNEGTAD